MIEKVHNSHLTCSPALVRPLAELRPALFTGIAGVIELDKQLWTPQAGQVHRLGWQMAQAGLFTEREKLLPIYLRKPEAQEVWEKKHGMYPD